MVGYLIKNLSKCFLWNKFYFHLLKSYNIYMILLTKVKNKILPQIDLNTIQ